MSSKRTTFRVRRRGKARSVVFAPTGEQRAFVRRWLSGKSVGVIAARHPGPHEGSRGGLLEIEVATDEDARRLEAIAGKLKRLLNGRDNTIAVERAVDSSRSDTTTTNGSGSGSGGDDAGSVAG